MAVTYVYVLQSQSHRSQFYVGMTEGLAERLATHNSGGSSHTAHHRPWELRVSVGFADEQKARQFERYLKSGSGRAFAARHFR